MFTVLLAGCALLLSPAWATTGPAATGEVALLAGVVGLAVWAWCRSRGDAVSLRALVTPPTAIRTRRRAAGPTAVPGQKPVPGRKPPVGPRQPAD